MSHRATTPGLSPARKLSQRLAAPPLTSAVTRLCSPVTGHRLSECPHLRFARYTDKWITSQCAVTREQASRCSCVESHQKRLMYESEPGSGTARVFAQRRPRPAAPP
jgi:hypothetical protein